MKFIGVMVLALFGALFVSAAFSRADTLTLCVDQEVLGAKTNVI